MRNKTNFLKKATSSCMKLAMTTGTLFTAGTSYGYYRPKNGNNYYQAKKSHISNVDNASKLKLRKAFLQLSKDYFDSPTTKIPSQIGLSKGQKAKELIILDQGVKQRHIFYQQAKPGIEIIEIDAQQPGFSQLLGILARFENLDAIHLVSHAKDGVLLLGNEEVKAEDLKANRNSFRLLNQALKPGGDLLLYGCDLAKGQNGEDLLQLIKGNTHADIAASNDKTGNEINMADWDLEIKKGDIEATPLPESIALNDFTEVLQFTGTVTFDNATPFGGNYHTVGTYGGETLVASSSKEFDGQYGVLSHVYGYGGGSISLFFASGASFNATSIYLRNDDTFPYTFTVQDECGNSYTTSSNLSPGQSTTVNFNFSAITKFTVSSGSFDITLDNFVISVPVTPRPEISVEGNNIEITDGDLAPTTTDATDFGSINSGSSSTKTFTIRNTSTATLNITTPITISGINSGDFTVTSQPSGTVAAGGSTTFDVQFSPGAAGLRTAEISIANNDCNENPYNFAIQGTGNASNPAITPSVTSVNLTGTPTTYSTASAAQTYTLNATDLTTNVTVTVDKGFELSLDGTTYATSITVPEATAEGAGQTIHVRVADFACESTGITGTITHTATGAADKTVTVSGTVGTGTAINTSLSFVRNSTTSVTVNWTNPTGNITNFDLLRATDDICNQYQVIATGIAPLTASHTDATVVNGTTYYYKVRFTPAP